MEYEGNLSGEVAEASGGFSWFTAERVDAQAALPTAFRLFWEEEERCLIFSHSFPGFALTADTGRALAQAALDAGLKEICFTDHLDYDPTGQMGDLTFRTEDYNGITTVFRFPG